MHSFQEYMTFNATTQHISLCYLVHHLDAEAALAHG